MEGTAQGAFSASGCERLGKQLKVNPSVEPPHRVVVFGQRETPPLNSSPSPLSTLLH